MGELLAAIKTMDMGNGHAGESIAGLWFARFRLVIPSAAPARSFHVDAAIPIQCHADACYRLLVQSC